MSAAFEDDGRCWCGDWGCHACHQIREGAGGVSYSYAILGVLCGACEAEMADYERQDWWDSLSEKEKVAVRWENAVSRVSYAWQRRPMAKLRAGEPEPPF